MGAKISRLFSMMLGGIIGYHLGKWLVISMGQTATELYIPNLFGIIAVGIMFGYLMSPTLHREIVNFNKWVDGGIEKLTPRAITFGAWGLIIGLVIANLILIPFYFLFKQPQFFVSLFVISNLVFGYVGLLVGGKVVLSSTSSHRNNAATCVPKILDTSVIIDGRIVDIYQTNFMEGKLLVPDFVFIELKRIADSTDYLRKNRGRKGLDALRKMQENFGDNVEIIDTEFRDTEEVDDKIIELARKLKCDVITNDYNLNKAAVIKDVRVLNINDLSNAVKSMVLPGEDIRLEVIKEGKERDQGVGYLDDGTMVVVEEGKQYLGEAVDMTVTNILQTSAGRVVFARPKDSPARRGRYN